MRRVYDRCMSDLTRRELFAAAIGLTAYPLIAASPRICTLTCASTLGPCYYDGTLVRRDITEGKAGLPALLSFLVVNADTCAPIENASIDIWHTDARGVYSGPINMMCNSADLTARSM